DECFIVLSGTMIMQFRDREVTVGAGEMITVPAGVEHNPASKEECTLLLIEKRGTVHTGSATDDDRTVEKPERL
ncbi:MAG: cupin domain-containing protein, partial [Chloroflexota bacterium]